MFRIHSCLYLFCLSLSISPTNGHEEYDVEQSHPSNVSRLIIHTYLEPFTDRGMTVENHQALLDFWKSSWEQAGWHPVVLSRNDASQHADYTRFMAVLRELYIDDYCEMLLIRWLAMAQVGGGWLADYDVFPLQPFAAEKLPNDGELTVHGPVAPSLASGSAEAWLTTAWALVENVKEQQHRSDSKLMFWTDTLGILHLLRNETFPIHSERHVAEGHYGLEEKEFSKDDCHARPFRNKWVVHFGPLTMQRGVMLPGELRLPKHRVTVAKEWLPKWYQACRGMEAVAATD